MWILLGILLRVLITLRARAVVLRVVLADLLLGAVVLLVPIIIQLAMVILKATLTALAVHALPTGTAVDDARRLGLVVRGQAWVQELCVLIL